MKKFIGIVVLILLCSTNAYADKIIYLGGSSWKMDDGRDKDFTFNEGGSCEYSYVNLWRSTYKDCQWQQEGPKVKIIINKGHYIIDGYISGQNFKGRTISKSHGTGAMRGYVTYHEKVYKNWVSPEEKLRIAAEKKRQEQQKELQRKAKEYEQKKLAEANKKNNQLNSSSSGREKAKQSMMFKGGTAFKGFLGGLIGMAIGFGLYSIMDRKIKKKLNDKFFIGAAFFIGWLLTKFI